MIHPIHSLYSIHYIIYYKLLIDHFEENTYIVSYNINYYTIGMVIDIVTAFFFPIKHTILGKKN